MLVTDVASTKKPKLGRPFSEDEPLDSKVCVYVTQRERDRLRKWASAEDKRSDENVTMAEVLRRVFREALDRSGF